MNWLGNHLNRLNAFSLCLPALPGRSLSQTSRLSGFHNETGETDRFRFPGEALVLIQEGRFYLAPPGYFLALLERAEAKASLAIAPISPRFSTTVIPASRMALILP